MYLVFLSQCNMCMAVTIVIVFLVRQLLDMVAKERMVGRKAQLPPVWANARPLHSPSESGQRWHPLLVPLAVQPHPTKEY